MCAMDGIDRNNLEMNVNINIISPLEQFNVIGYGLVTNGGIIMLLMILVVVNKICNKIANNSNF